MLLAAFLPVMPANAETSTLGISITETMSRGDTYTPDSPLGDAGTVTTGTTAFAGSGTVTITNNLATTDLYNIAVTLNKGNTNNWVVPAGVTKDETVAGKITLTIPKLAHGSNYAITYSIINDNNIPLRLTADYDQNKVNVGGYAGVTMTLVKDTTVISNSITGITVTITPKDLDSDLTKDWVFSNCVASKGTATVNGDGSSITWDVGTLLVADANPTLSFRTTENDANAHDDGTNNVALWDMATSTVSYSVPTSPTTAGVSLDGSPTAVTSKTSTDLTKQQMPGNSWQFQPEITNTNTEDVTFTLNSVSFWATKSDDLATSVDTRTLTQGTIGGINADLPQDLNQGEIWLGDTFSFVYNHVPAGFIKPLFTVKDDSTQIPKTYSSTQGAGGITLLKKIYVLHGYNIEVVKTITDLGGGVYQIDITATNKGTKKSPDYVLVYDIVPSGFTASDFTPATTGDAAVLNPVSGHAYWWNVGPLNAGAHADLQYRATGAGDYDLTDIFLIGVDPAQSMNLQSTPSINNVSTMVSSNFETLAALGAAGLLVIGMIGTARRRF